MMFGKMCKMFMDLTLLYAHVTINYSVKWIYNYMLKESTKLILELNYSAFYWDLFLLIPNVTYLTSLLSREKKNKRKRARPISFGKILLFPNKDGGKKSVPISPNLLINVGKFPNQSYTFQKIYEMPLS